MEKVITIQSNTCTPFSFKEEIEDGKEKERINELLSGEVIQVKEDQAIWVHPKTITFISIRNPEEIKDGNSERDNSNDQGI